jgi:hypothetical protein
MKNSQSNTSYKNLGNFRNRKKGREQKDEENKTVSKQSTIDQKKLVNFTYYGKEVKRITKLFNYTNVRIPYETNNNLEKSYCTRPNRTKAAVMLKLLKKVHQTDEEIFL